jgi:hypothetical protein
MECSEQTWKKLRYRSEKAQKKRRKSPTLAKGARMGHPSSKATSQATSKASSKAGSKAQLQRRNF